MAVFHLIRRSTCLGWLWSLMLAWCLASGAAAADEPPPASSPGSASASTPRRPPRTEWEVSFDDDTPVLEYARMLDYFGIEVAAVSRSGKVESIKQVGSTKPVKHVGRTADDPRLYIGWKSGTLVAADRKLLAKANIQAQGKELWHYFPEDVQRQMAVIERAYAKRDPGQIKRTQFAVRPKKSGDGYEFYVVQQQLHGQELPVKPASAEDSASQQR